MAQMSPLQRCAQLVRVASPGWIVPSGIGEDLEVCVQQARSDGGYRLKADIVEKASREVARSALLSAQRRRTK